jgi:hypothetical protein
MVGAATVNVALPPEITGVAEASVHVVGVGAFVTNSWYVVFASTPVTVTVRLLLSQTRIGDNDTGSRSFGRGLIVIEGPLNDVMHVVLGYVPFVMLASTVIWLVTGAPGFEAWIALTATDADIGLPSPTIVASVVAPDVDDFTRYVTPTCVEARLSVTRFVPLVFQQYAEPVEVVTVGFVGFAKIMIVGCCVSGVVHVLNVEVAGFVTAETRYS